MRSLLSVIFCLAAATEALAGPVDFGKAEFERAIAERKLASLRLRLQTEVSGDVPESFQIVATRVSGGDLRGVMYGLLEAAEQIRTKGRLTAATGRPATRVRGVRLTVSPEDVERDWFWRRDAWDDTFAAMARSRLNRLNLVLTEGVVIAERVLDALRTISDSASGFAVDVAVTVAPGVLPGGDAQLEAILRECPSVRSVGLRIGAGGPARRDTLVRAAAQAGRRIVVEVPQAEVTPGLLGELADLEVPYRWITDGAGGVSQAATVSPAEVIRDQGDSWVGGGAAPDGATIRRAVEALPDAVGFELAIRHPRDVESPAVQLWGRLGYQPAVPPAPVKPAAAKPAAAKKAPSKSK
jgi:hypothetical protein